MNIRYEKNIPVKYDVDVFVAGGGPAGVAAAVTAAESGASVFVAETFGAFGGAAVHALVPAFMQFTDGVRFLAGGIGHRVYDCIAENSPDSYKKYCPRSIPVEVLKLCYDEMMVSSGARFEFFCRVCDVVTSDGHIEYAICDAKGELFAVKAKIFIDCTGDGDIAALAGAIFSQGDESGVVMASTLCAIWNGINWDNVVRPDSRELQKAFDDKIFTNTDRHLPGMWSIGPTVGGSNAGHIYDIDGTKAESLTRGMIEGRRQLTEYRNYYRNYLTGYENAEPVISATQIGIRESRRIMGDYVLNLNDFMTRADFDDEIGRYSYPVDIHSGKNTDAGYKEYEKKFKELVYAKGESYGIPYRSLTVKGFDNLLVAGRCISADRSMQSSTRVMPCCFITGEAAGFASYLAVKTGKDTRGIDVSLLQDMLLKTGSALKKSHINN